MHWLNKITELLLLQILVDIIKQYGGAETELLATAELLLPQLLVQFGGTMSAVDQSILRLLQALDCVLSESTATEDIAAPPGAFAVHLL